MNFNIRSAKGLVNVKTPLHIKKRETNRICLSRKKTICLHTPDRLLTIRSGKSLNLAMQLFKFRLSDTLG